MDIKLLKSDILSNNIPKLLIFIEEESALSKQYITKISDTLNKAYKYYATADEVIYDITTNMKEDFVYVIYNDKKILSKAEYIMSLSQLNRNIVICFPSIDKSSDFYRQNNKYIVIFEKLDEYSLLAYAQKLCAVNKITVSQDKLLQIVRQCDCNLGILLNELDKIFTLGLEDSNQLVNYLLNDGFPDYRKTNIFQFIKKVLNKDKSAYIDAKKIDDSPVTVAYNMYNMARNALVTSRNPFYGVVMQKCTEVYNGIIDGTLSTSYALNYLLYSIFSLYG